MQMMSFLKTAFCYFVAFNIVFAPKVCFGAVSEHVKIAQKLLNETVSILKEKDKTSDEKKQILIERYVKNIDFDWNAKMALGRLFLQLPQNEQKKYLIEYKKFITYTWLSKLGQNILDGVNMKIKEKSSKINENEEYVTLLIKLDNSEIYEAVLRTKLSNGVFKILNINIEGIDLAAAYRADFLSYIEQHDGNPKNIIKYLEDQNKRIKKTSNFEIPK